jgi:putative peptide zinc metalloprotease protein
MSSVGLQSDVGQRELPVRARPDLVVSPQWFGGRRYWGVQDPVTLRCFQLREEEHFVLEQLRQPTTVTEIKARFERRFAPRKLDSRHLQSFLGLLFRQGLLMSDAPGQGEQLRLRGQRQFRATIMSGLANLLAIRLPGFHPGRGLHWLHARCRWMYSRWCVAGCCLLMTAALLLTAIQFESLRERWPTFQGFFSPQNIVWLIVALGTTKILHELAHGLTCVHFGGECHEIGMMLLVFTPCLYCDVTSAWLLPSKWHRMAVGLAGIYVEMVLAAAATLGWWFTEPGLLNSLLLNMMVICSVNTLLINGNPLLRFDGYFVLSDLLEVPNLQPRARDVVVTGLRHWLFDLQQDRTPAVREHHLGWLALYAVASILYRLTVVVAILVLLQRAFRGTDLELLAQLITVAVVIGMVGPATWKTVRWFQDPGQRRQLRPGHAASRLAWAALLVAGVLLVPLPSRLLTPAMMEPEDVERIYVSVPGLIRSAVTVGQAVQAGDTLAQLENSSISREIAELTAEIELQRVRLANLRGARVADATVEKQIPVVEESLRDFEQRLQQRRADQARLTLRSSGSGTVLPSPRAEDRAADGALPRWSGDPLSARNRGAYLETGTLLCLVGDPRRLQGLLVIDQSDVDLVRIGQRVRILVFEQPQQVLEGKIKAISELRLDTAPRELLVAGLLPTQAEGQGARPTRTSYLARVSIDNLPSPVLMAAAGRARIHTAPRSIAARVYRYLKGTLRFQL